MSRKKASCGIKKYSIIFGILIFIILISGCTGSIPSRSSENQTIPAGTTAPTLSTSLSVSTPSSVTITPQEVTAPLGPLKTIKDSELWFTMQVPETWEVTTERMSIPEGYEGLVYYTYLHENPVLFNTHEFYIITYAITRNFDQAVRDTYRNRKMNESSVKINGITFDRFESKTDDTVTVAYVVRKSSANERGFASVIEYSLNPSSQYQQKDFEFFISTFQYKGAKEIKSAAGEEIKR